MSEITAERAKLDEIELFYYGICSTQLYVDYRDNIDQKLKCTMVELARYYEQIGEDKGQIKNKLFKNYQAFWAQAEPKLQNFYEEIQKILALPPSFIPKDISPQLAFNTSEIKMLEAEIKELEEKCKAEKYLLHQLGQRQQIFKTVCQPLKSEMDFRMQAFKSDIKKGENLEKSDAVRTEKWEKFSSNIDKATFNKVTVSNVETCNREEMREIFRRFRLEETDEI